MKKRYFYEFKGTVYLEADNQDEAEELIMGISFVDYLIDEDLFEIDEHYVPADLEKREEINAAYGVLKDAPRRGQIYRLVTGAL